MTDKTSKSASLKISKIKIGGLMTHQTMENTSKKNKISLSEKKKTQKAKEIISLRLKSWIKSMGMRKRTTLKIRMQTMTRSLIRSEATTINERESPTKIEVIEVGINDHIKKGQILKEIMSFITKLIISFSNIAYLKSQVHLHLK